MQVFSSEYCENFKNTYFEEDLLGEQPLLYWLFSDNLLTSYEQLSY